MGQNIAIIKNQNYKICLKHSGNKHLTAPIQVKKYSSSIDFDFVSLTKSSSCLVLDGGFER